MRIKDVIGKAVKEAILPELTLLRGDIGDLRADVKVISGRLDAVEKRMDEIKGDTDRRMDDLKDGQKDLAQDVKNLQRYVWDAVMPRRESGEFLLREDTQEEYGKD